MEVITNAWLGLTKMKNISIYKILQPMKQRSNTHQCTSKELHTIGIYGGNEEFSHIIEILSKMIFLNIPRHLEKVFVFQNSPYYNKKAT